MKPTTYRQIFTRALLSNGEGEFHIMGCNQPPEIMDRPFVNDKFWGDDTEVCVLTKGHLYLLDDVVTGGKFVRVIARDIPLFPFHLSALPWAKK